MNGWGGNVMKLTTMSYKAFSGVLILFSRTAASRRFVALSVTVLGIPRGKLCKKKRLWLPQGTDQEQGLKCWIFLGPGISKNSCNPDFNIIFPRKLLPTGTKCFCESIEFYDDKKTDKENQL